MKIVGVLRIASLLLLPGAIAPVYAQGREQEKQPEQKAQQAKPAQQQPRAQQQAKPAQQQPRTQQQAKPAQGQQRVGQQAKPAQQQPRAQQQGTPAQGQQRAGQQAKPAQQQPRAQQQARPAQGQQQANRAQPVAGHGRIPDDRFRASFGRGHTFRVNRADFAGGSRRFQYGGYWFALINPWPVAWLYTDSVYVDYLNGGYFLCDPVHPGVYLSITVG